MLDEARILISREAEAAVLGACLLDPKAVDTCSAVLGVSDFYHEPARIVWEIVTELHNEGRPVDMVTVMEVMQSRSQLEKIGGPSGLAALTVHVGDVTNVEAYARIVKDKSLRRAMVRAVNETLADANGNGETSEILALAQERLLAISEARADDFELAGQNWQADFDILKAASEGGRPIGYPTGLASWDRVMGGILPGKVYVLGGRPGEGKSALALTFAMALARAKTPVAFFSTEMDKAMIRNRMAAGEGELDGFQIEQGRLTAEHLEIYKSVMLRWGALPLHVFHDPNLQLVRLLALARVAVSRLRVRALFVDYMQMVEDDSRQHGTSAAELGFICKRLAQFARSHRIAVIEVSQLRRAVRESDKDRAPRIEELKESGGLEEAADVVALLHSTEQQKREQRERQYGPVTCAIAKHRGGPVSEIELSFAGRHLKFFSEA